MSHTSALTDLFKSFDTGNTGYIGKDDFIESIDLLVGESGEGVNAVLFTAFDEHSHNEVSLPEFIVFCEALN